MQLYHNIVDLDLRRTYYKVTVSEKSKQPITKASENKDQYDF